MLGLNVSDQAALVLELTATNLTSHRIVRRRFLNFYPKRKHKQLYLGHSKPEETKEIQTTEQRDSKITREATGSNVKESTQSEVPSPISSKQSGSFQACKAN